MAQGIGCADKQEIVECSRSFAMNTPITRSQREAIKRLYDQSPDGAVSYLAFRRRFMQQFPPQEKYLGAQWCGMFIGIEADGYAHS
jgi:hypothetical protein